VKFKDMNKGKLFLFATIVISCQTKQNEIVGAWQNYPIMASGWNDAYQFYENGEYRFNYNTMDCQKRVIRHSGTYVTESDSILVLTTTDKLIIEGGKLVEAMGSCASDYEIEGGKEKLVKLDKPEILKLKVSSITIDKLNDDKSKVLIGGIEYWRVDKDPKVYQTYEE
jgi:hypothetical protein